MDIWEQWEQERREKQTPEERHEEFVRLERRQKRFQKWLEWFGAIWGIGFFLWEIRKIERPEHAIITLILVVTFIGCVIVHEIGKLLREIQNTQDILIRELRGFSAADRTNRTGAFSSGH